MFLLGFSTSPGLPVGTPISNSLTHWPRETRLQIVNVRKQQAGWGWHGKMKLALEQFLRNWILCLTLWLCSDSCHSRCVPGQKWPDSKQLLINLSLCYIITKYWIHSFCQLVFFHLGLVLCFYLHLINRRPHLSESRLLIFWVKKSFFMNNFSQY